MTAAWRRVRARIARWRQQRRIAAYLRGKPNTRILGSGVSYEE